MIKVGDKVRIVNAGKTYDMYKDWAEKYGLTLFIDREVPNKGDIGEVIAVGNHMLEGMSDRVLCAVRVRGVIDYIMEDKALEKVEVVKVNGVDGKDNPLNFTKEMVKPFMRLKMKNGNQYIAVPCNKRGINLVRENENHMPVDFERSDAWKITHVFDAPFLSHQALVPSLAGELLWKRQENVQADNKFAERIAFFQTHIDAVKENLASLEAEFEKLKQGK